MKRRLLMLVLSISMALTPVSVYAQEQNIATEEDMYKGFAYTMADLRGIDPYLILAQVEKESHWHPDAENSGCVGLMQINPRWQKARMEELGLTDLTEPLENLQCGIDFMGDLIEKHDGNVHYALMEYNGGAQYLYRNVSAGHTSSSYSRYIVNRAEELRAEAEK